MKELTNEKLSKKPLAGIPANEMIVSKTNFNEELSREPLAGIPVNEMIIYETGSNDNRATWVHPEVAIDIAQWISPKFRVRVNRWIYELAVTGQVKLGEEKSQHELDSIWKNKCIQLEEENSQLQLNLKNFEKKFFNLNCNHERLKERRIWAKFKIDNCFYIVYNMNQKTLDFKFGITSDINARLADYRTIAPYTKLMYLLYIKEHKFLEDAIKIYYKANINPANHEFIINQDYKNIVNKVEDIVKILNLNHEVAINIDKYNNIIEDNFNIEIQNRV